MCSCYTVGLQYGGYSVTAVHVCRLTIDAITYFFNQSTHHRRDGAFRGLARRQLGQGSPLALHISLYRVLQWYPPTWRPPTHLVPTHLASTNLASTHAPGTHAPGTHPPGTHPPGVYPRTWYPPTRRLPTHLVS